MLSLDPSAAPCYLHKYHSPRLWRTVRHHVIPEAWTTQLGQPAAHRVVICDTANYAIHMLIDAMRLGKVHPKMPPNYTELAQEAIDWWEENGRPPVHVTSLENPNVRP
jgi:hypothetical protein